MSVQITLTPSSGTPDYFNLPWAQVEKDIEELRSNAMQRIHATLTAVNSGRTKAADEHLYDLLEVLGEWQYARTQIGL